jgi:hypothetical protein
MYRKVSYPMQPVHGPSGVPNARFGFSPEVEVIACVGMNSELKQDKRFKKQISR